MSVCMDLALFNRVIVEAPTAKVQRYRKIAGEARHHASPQRFKKSVLVSRSGCSRMLIWRYYSQFYALRAMLGPMVHRYRATHHLSFPSPCAVSFQCHLPPWFISIFCSLQDSILLQKNGRSKTTSNGPKSNNAWSDFIYDMEFPFGSVSKKAFSVSSSLQLGLSKDSSTTKQVIDASTYYTKGTKVQVKRQ